MSGEFAAHQPRCNTLFKAEEVSAMTVQLPIEQVQFDRAGRHLTAYLAGEIDAAETPEMEKQV